KLATVDGTSPSNQASTTVRATPSTIHTRKPLRTALRVSGLLQRLDLHAQGLHEVRTIEKNVKSGEVVGQDLELVGQHSVKEMVDELTTQTEHCPDSVKTVS
ncbi:MAG TPA: hypothetical protein VKU87_04900, partial [Thermomicrobiaceae bacterium]|nr:hypothetical protein [Thermomicrobiaceae bacterium]